ncbi:helix-hairpin-helix domain-containing protein [Candidatus Margulisiibacteriota bacterium]
MGDLSKEEKRILIILGILLLLGMLYYFIQQAPRSQTSIVEQIIDTPTLNNTFFVTENIYIHISGAVKTPGVYKLDASARVWEAINAAGGPLASTDLDKLNLTKKLTDGDKILVTYKETQNSAKNITQVSSAKININTASLQELDSLPKVGPSTAKRIVEQRNKQYFQKIEDVQKVKGIGKKMFEKLKDRLEV